MEIKEFFTREKCNKGKKLFLPAPDGTITDEWLMLIGADSDAYRKNKTGVFREAMEKGEKADQEMLTAALVAGAVSDWSFKIPCTSENVAELLHNAPYLLEAIDKFVSDRGNFTKGA